MSDAGVLLERGVSAMVIHHLEHAGFKAILSGTSLKPFLLRPCHISTTPASAPNRERQTSGISPTPREA